MKEEKNISNERLKEQATKQPIKQPLVRTTEQKAEHPEKQPTKHRYAILDLLRGVNLISMILYHAAWDIVFIAGIDWEWYHSKGAYVWQQCICWTFILLSGFCVSMGRHALKRGLIVFGAGGIVTAVTLIASPEQRIIFGVLTLLGACMILFAFLKRILSKIPGIIGEITSLFLFFLTRNINGGYLGFENINLVELPDILYEQGNIMTFLGFTEITFFSTDYFSLFPWFFLFLAGYYLYRIMEKKELLFRLQKITLPENPFSFIGRHSLVIYMLHQPVIYAGVLMYMHLSQ